MGRVIAQWEQLEVDRTFIEHKPQNSALSMSSLLMLYLQLIKGRLYILFRSQLALKDL